MRAIIIEQFGGPEKAGHLQRGSCAPLYLPAVDPDSQATHKNISEGDLNMLMVLETITKTTQFTIQRNFAIEAPVVEIAAAMKEP